MRRGPSQLVCIRTGVGEGETAAIKRRYIKKGLGKRGETKKKVAEDHRSRRER